VAGRFLLAACGDGGIVVYDTQSPALSGGAAAAAAASRPGAGGAGAKPPDAPAASDVALALPRGHPGGHRFAVASVAWYPVDTGAFVSGALDGVVKLWDTNAGEAVSAFELGSRVHCVAMSPLASGHCLVAAAGEARCPQLLDPASGAATHSLVGHREAAGVVAWSRHSEHELASGDASGVVKVWDVRRAGALRTLDEQRTARPARPQARPPATAAAPPPPGAGGRRPAAAAKRRRRPSDGGGGSDGGADAAAAAAAADAVARAHHGAVSALHATPDGLHYVTAAADQRVRLWDARDGTHALVHYPHTRSRASDRARQMVASDDGAVLFHPSGATVQARA